MKTLLGRGRWLGTNLNPVLDSIFGGWVLSGVNTMTSGQPINFRYGPSPVTNNLPSFLGGVALRPNVICDPINRADRPNPTSGYFVRSCLTTPPLNSPFGNAGRNIAREIKSSPAEDNVYNPIPTVFAKKVYDEILADKMQKNVIIQSFDARPLQEMRKFPVKLPLSFLVMNKDGIEKNIANLGFQPDIYSPHFSLVDEATVAYCREHNIKIIPWTINEIADLERIKNFNLDGIITDYPKRAIKVFRTTKK